MVKIKETNKQKQSKTKTKKKSFMCFFRKLYHWTPSVSFKKPSLPRNVIKVYSSISWFKYISFKKSNWGVNNVLWTARKNMGSVTSDYFDIKEKLYYNFQVRYREDVYTWLQDTAIPALYPTHHYNGARVSNTLRHFVASLNNLRISPLILRQVRVRSGML